VTRAVAISGTPGTGKSSVGRLLARRIDAELLELGEIVKEHNLFLGRDSSRDTLIADLEALEDFLTKRLQEARRLHIVVGHFADVVPDNLLEFLVVLRCHPLLLAQRLRRRRWSHEKILENVQAEILGDCTAHALERYPAQKIYEVDTSQRTDDQVASCIQEILAGRGASFAVGSISWLSSLDAGLLHQIMEEGRLPL